jgi:hypothetical protein
MTPKDGNFNGIVSFFEFLHSSVSVLPFISYKNIKTFLFDLWLTIVQSNVVVGNSHKAIFYT